MEKIQTILTNCIEDIKSGKADLAECLDRYPSRRPELEPLLKIALNIQEPQFFKLDNSYRQTAKAQLLRQIRTTRQKHSWSFTDIFSFGIPRQLVWAKVAAAVLVGVIVVSVLGGGTAYASQSSLPGDFLYPVKIVTEDARLLIAGNSSAKVALNLKFAGTRLVEMSKLAAGYEIKTELAVNGYRGNLNAARENIGRISDTSARYSTLENALEDIHNQVAFCDDVIYAGPAYVARVSEASALAINEQVQLLGILAQQNILRAAQINLDAMQNRLQLARSRANDNRYETMQEALLQYQQFNRLGEQILQSAQTSNNDHTEIETLSLQALSGYLDTLDSLSQHVPLEYRDSIEVSRRMTLQFGTQAGYGYQHQGDSDQGSNAQPPGNGDGSTTGQEGQATPQYQGGGGDTGNQTPNITTPSSGTGGNTESGSGTGAGGGPGSGGGSGASPAGTATPSSGTGGSTESGSENGAGGGSSSGGGSGPSPTDTTTPSSGTGGSTESGSGTGSDSGENPGGTGGGGPPPSGGNAGHEGGQKP